MTKKVAPKKAAPAKKAAPTEEEWIRIGEATHVFGYGISRPVLKRLIQDAGIQVLKLNKEIRIRRSDVEELSKTRFGPIE